MNQYKLHSGFNIRRALISLALVMLVGYGLFNARNIILGPSIEILAPQAGAETADTTVMIRGIAKNITFVSLNERPILVDTSGIFEEKLLLSPGFNTIRVYARDRFNKETEEIISIYSNHKES